MAKFKKDKQVKYWAVSSAPDDKIVDNDSVTQGGEVPFGKEGTDLEIERLKARESEAGRTARWILHPAPPTLENSRENRCHCAERRDWRCHTSQLLPRTNSRVKSRDCPDDPPRDHRTIWGDAGLGSQSYPQRLRVRIRRAQ